MGIEGDGSGILPEDVYAVSNETNQSNWARLSNRLRSHPIIVSQALKTERLNVFLTITFLCSHRSQSPVAHFLNLKHAVVICGQMTQAEAVE